MGIEHQLLEANMDFLDRVVEVEQSCFSDPWPTSAFLAEFSHPWSYFKVLVRDKHSKGTRVDGYIIAWMLPDDMHLLKMAVLPNWRRKGLARFMLDDCLMTFGNCGGGVASLEVRPSNSAALALYSSFGFRQVAVRRGYYSKDHEDALLLLKDIAVINDESVHRLGE